MRKLEQLDSYDFRNGLLFMWMAVILLFAGAIAVKFRADGLVFVFGFGVFAAIISAVWYFARAYQQTAAATYQDEDEEREQNPAIEDDATPQLTENIETLHELEPKPAKLNQEALRLRVNLYAFVHGVCRQGVLGEVAWAKRGLPAATYRKWIAHFEAIGIVSEGAKGQTRTVKMYFDDALELIAQQSGDPDFWREASQYYNPGPPSSTLLILQDAS